MLKGRRVGKVIKITTFQTVKRGNWLLRFSVTDMGSILLLCSLTTNIENTFIKFFNTEEEAVSFVDFLVTQEQYEIGDTE
jgi:hypothetical protein